MSAIDAALNQIDEVAADGDLTPARHAGESLELETPAEPILLPDGKRIYPPLLYGEPIDRVACALLDMHDPAESRFLRLIGPPGCGKALAIDTDIATPNGWTPMGELRVGDEVFDETGRPTRIIATSGVMTGRDCLEVVFSDGSTIVADAEHLWVTETRADRERPRRTARHGGYIARRVGANAELATVDAASGRCGPDYITRRELARELDWDTARGYERVKTASVLCERVGHRGREVLYRRVELLGSLARVLTANVGAHNAQRIASGPIATRELAATVRTGDDRANHAIPVAPPLELREVRLPVAPRLLGLWLGDGDARGATYSSADRELVEEFAARYRVTRAGRYRYTIASASRVHRRPLPCGACGAMIEPGRDRRWYCDGCRASRSPLSLRLPVRRCRCGVELARGSWSDACARCQAEGSLLCQLRTLGVLGSKHIPPVYQRASVAQRRALLSGLLDSDGTVSPGGTVQYTTTRARLAADVHELVCSLGYRAILRAGRAKLRGKDCGAAWTIEFTARSAVFGLARKQAMLAQRVRVANDARTRLRYVVDVRPVQSVPVRCIQVDSRNGMFLAGRTLVATHNSQIARAIAYRLWTDRGQEVEQRHGAPFYGYVEIIGGPSSDEYLFRHEFVPAEIGGEVRLVDSAFVQAMRHGWTVMIDEANTIRDVALLSCNSVFDSRLQLYLPATGETVTARPGFAAMLAYNPGLVGASDIPDAWHSRFPATLEVTSNWAALAQVGAPQALVAEAMSLDRQRIAGEDGLVWTPQFRDIEALWRMIDRVGERAALAFFASNLFEQLQAGKLQDAEAAAACRMLDQAGYAHLKTSATGGRPNLHGYPRAVSS